MPSRATRVDPSQLENALLNLCLNARDAMRPTGGTLRLETANILLDEAAATALELRAGAYVVLSVADAGTGVAPDALPRIFDPFHTTQPMGRGTGLGLPMVYGFARQSGGQVRAASRIGEARIEAGLQVLTKPFEIAALTRRVRELLAGRAVEVA